MTTSDILDSGNHIIKIADDIEYLLWDEKGLEENKIRFDEGELKSINLSACGIAFHSDEDLIQDQSILLQLKLKPSNVSIVTTGKVIDTGAGNGKNIIRIDFQNLGENNQDLLMQHLFHVQSRVLKKQRARE